MTIIEYKDVNKKYGENEVVQNFNLKISQGDFVTIIGSSGCGKTTILKMINGLVSPSSGNIFINEKNIKEWDLISLRRNIGYAIQGSVLFPHMNIEKNIGYVLNLSKKPDKIKIRISVEKWLETVGLEPEMLKRYPWELSGGQQQRVGIARALVASPEILLMDEPFGAVDEITRASLQDEIGRIHKESGITILFITHDINEAIKLGTKILVMDKGEIIQYSSPKELIENPTDPFVESLLFRYKNNERSCKYD